MIPRSRELFVGAAMVAVVALGTQVVTRKCAAQNAGVLSETRASFSQVPVLADATPEGPMVEINHGDPVGVSRSYTSNMSREDVLQYYDKWAASQNWALVKSRKSAGSSVSKLLLSW